METLKQNKNDFLSLYTNIDFIIPQDPSFLKENNLPYQENIPLMEKLLAYFTEARYYKSNKYSKDNNKYIINNEKNRIGVLIGDKLDIYILSNDSIGRWLIESCSILKKGQKIEITYYLTYAFNEYKNLLNELEKENFNYTFRKYRYDQYCNLILINSFGKPLVNISIHYKDHSKDINDEFSINFYDYENDRLWKYENDSIHIIITDKL